MVDDIRLPGWQNPDVTAEASRGARITLVLEAHDGDDGALGQFFEHIVRIAADRSTVLVDGTGRPAAGPTPPKSGLLTAGDLTIDMTSHEVRWRSHVVELTEQELKILAALARDSRALSYAELAEAAWGTSYLGDPDFIRSAVKRLRRKFAALNSSVVIASVRGFGFRLVP